MFRSAQTIVRPLLQKRFQNKVKRSAVIIHAMASHMCHSGYYNARLYKTITIFRRFVVSLAGGYGVECITSSFLQLSLEVLKISGLR